MKKKKQSKITLIKKLNELNLVANLIVNMMKTEKFQYLFLNGEIGSGKTTLVKEIAKILNEQKEVISPSFNKMLVYDEFVHIDAYNMQNQSIIPFQDYFENKIVIIEWVNNLIDDFTEGFVIDIEYVDDQTRKYEIYWKE